MVLFDSLTPDGIGIILTIAGLFGGAMFWLGMVHNRLKATEKNVDSLLQETRGLTALQRDVDRLLDRTEALSVRIEQHRLSVEALQESERIRKGMMNKKDEH